MLFTIPSLKMPNVDLESVMRQLTETNKRTQQLWLTGDCMAFIARGREYLGGRTIRGFGLVLIVGVLVSMFTAITVTRTVLRIVVAQPWARRASLYGVTEAEFLARPSGTRVRGEARGRV